MLLELTQFKDHFTPKLPSFISNFTFPRRQRLIPSLTCNLLNLYELNVCLSKEVPWQDCLIDILIEDRSQHGKKLDFPSLQKQEKEQRQLVSVRSQVQFSNIQCPGKLNNFISKIQLDQFKTTLFSENDLQYLFNFNLQLFHSHSLQLKQYQLPQLTQQCQDRLSFPSSFLIAKLLIQSSLILKQPIAKLQVFQDLAKKSALSHLSKPFLQEQLKQHCLQLNQRLVRTSLTNLPQFQQLQSKPCLDSKVKMERIMQKVQNLTNKLAGPPSQRISRITLKTQPGSNSNNKQIIKEGFNQIFDKYKYQKYKIKPSNSLLQSGQSALPKAAPALPKAAPALPIQLDKLPYLVGNVLFQQGRRSILLQVNLLPKDSKSLKIIFLNFSLQANSTNVVLTHRIIVLDDPLWSHLLKRQEHIPLITKASRVILSLGGKVRIEDEVRVKRHPDQKKVKLVTAAGYQFRFS